MVEKESKRSTNPSTAPLAQDEPPWLALAKKKAKAWSEMPQIVQWKAPLAYGLHNSSLYLHTHKQYMWAVIGTIYSLVLLNLPGVIHVFPDIKEMMHIRLGLMGNTLHLYYNLVCNKTHLIFFSNRLQNASNWGKKNPNEFCIQHFFENEPPSKLCFYLGLCE